MGNIGIAYCKYDGMKTFKAFDLSNGSFVDRLVYASMVDITDENKEKLQRLADLNKGINLKIQLRQGQKVMFMTK